MSNHAIHRQAMTLAQEGLMAQHRGDAGKANQYFSQAFELEKHAALSLLAAFDQEPTRSVLFRSAATLALDCGLYAEAEKMAAQGLAGNPPEDIAAELRSLYKDILLLRKKEKAAAQSKSKTTLKVEGVLREASAITNNIRIIDATGHSYRVSVPKGLTNIVKGYWGDKIRAVLLPQRNAYMLVEIQRAS